MKHKVSKQILSALLAFVMIIGLMPVTTLTTFAEELEPINSVSLSGLSMPVVGERISSVNGSALSEDQYGKYKYTVIDNQTADWMDEEGRLIKYGLQVFEAGRTYSISFNVKPMDGYAFTDSNIPVYMNNLYEYQYTGSIALSKETKIATVTYTFELAGERTYADISEFRFYNVSAPSDGDQAHYNNGVWAYNNSKMTDQYWADSEGNRLNSSTVFEGGYSYSYNYEFTAFDGYQFADNVLIRNDTVPVDWGYSFNADNTKIFITIPYYIESSAVIHSVTVADMFLPTQGGSTRDFDSKLYQHAPSGANYTVPNQTNGWYETTAEDSSETQYEVSEEEFIAGKQYKTFLVLHANDNYKFASPENVSFAFSGISESNYSYVITDGGSESIIIVAITFTAQFPEGVGNIANNPAVCHSYWEFKYAMENKDIQFVALGNVNETMPVGEEGLVTAIHVNGIKSLNLLGDANFTAPASNTTTYAALLHTEQNDTLNISGAGSLTFKAVANNSYNAVIYNQGGSVNISGGTLIGSHNTAVYGKAIWQSYGELRISGGQFFSENALAPLKLPRAATAVTLEGGQTWIQGGTFKTENVIDTIDLPYGLEIGEFATVDLSGGTFHGILLPTSSTPLANYMDEDLYTPLSNESKFNPGSECSQEYTASGKVVRIAWLINHVDVHINAPAVGVDITENYFNIPTSGCQVTMYYPQWYKNGEPVTYGTFEAGASYKVVVQIDAKAKYGAEFTNDVTAAINNQSVEVDRKSEHWIEVEYDFGECPATISDVELNVTAPKEGNTISYSVTDSSDAYGAVGSGNTITNYRAWYVSDDGSNYTRMSQGDKFVAGKYYKFSTWVRTTDGNEFPLYDNGVSIVPNVSATVNGYYANVIKAYDQDPARVIVVEYDFGMCNDSVIENITVVDVTEPVAGEYPSYTYNIHGSGYQMDTSKNAYLDVNWKNPPEQWYYVKNGISWWDVTDGGYDYVYENDTFIPGHQYQCKVYLKVEDGFEFAYNNGTPTATATMNGNTAEITMYGSGLQWEQQVTYTFTCSQAVLSAVEVSGIDAPVAGQTPDYTGTVGNAAQYNFAPYGYNNAGFRWTDSSDNLLSAQDTFLAGETYKLEIKLIPTSVNQVNACRFQTPVTATLNGKAVDTGDVIANASTVYIYCTYIVPDTTEYLVLYCSNGGSGTMIGDIVEQNSTFTLNTCTFNAPAGYKFKAWAIGSVNGEQKQPGEQITITGETYIYAIWEKDANTKPQNVKASAGDSKVTLTWDAVPGASNYAVFLRKGTTWLKIGASGTNTTFTSRGLANGGKYFYMVKAYVNGVWSEGSAIVSAIPVCITPQNVKAVGGAGQATITWDAVTGATNYAVMMKKGTNWLTLGSTGTKTSYTAKGLASGGKYYFVVKAFVNGAWSDMSETVAASIS